MEAKGYVISNVDMTTLVAESDRGSIKISAKVITTAGSNELFKVTYPGGVAYLKEGVNNQKITGIDEDVVALLESDTIASGAGAKLKTAASIASTHDFDFTTTPPTDDVEYKKAVPVTAANGVSGVSNVVVNKKDGTGLAQIQIQVVDVDGKTLKSFMMNGSGAVTHVQDNATLVLSEALAANRSYFASYAEMVVTLNGEELEPIEINEDGSFATTEITVDGVNPDTNAMTLTVAVGEERTAGDVKLFINDEEMTETDANGDIYYYPVDGEHLVYVGANGLLQLSTAATALGSTPDAYGRLVYDVSAAEDPDGDNEIYLYSAYQVIGANDAGGTVWKAYIDEECTTSIPFTGKYFLVDGAPTIYIESTNPKRLISWKDGTGEGLNGERGLAVDQTKDNVKGVWSWRVNKNLAAGDLVWYAAITSADLKVEFSTGNNTFSWNETKTVAGNGYGVGYNNLGTGAKKGVVSGELIPAAGDTEHQYVVTPGANGAFNITMTEGTDIPAPGAGTTTNIGELYLELTNGTVLKMSVVLKP